MERAVKSIRHDDTAKTSRSKRDTAVSSYFSVSDLPGNSLIQRKASCACGGGCPGCADDADLLSDKLDIQTKLTVGEVGDRYEQEADQVADLIMRTPNSSDENPDGLQNPANLSISSLHLPLISRIQRQARDGEMPEENREATLVQAKFNQPAANDAAKIAPLVSRGKSNEAKQAPTPPQIVQRQAAEETEDETEDETKETPIRMSAISSAAEPPPEDEEPIVSLKSGRIAPSAAPAVGASFEESLSRKRGGGQGMSPETQKFMEERFGVDFSGVRIHTDSESDNLNRAVNAYAFTTGKDIYFSSGMYQPGTASGDRLLAHELTHVVQQTGGTSLQRASTSNGFLIQRIPGTAAHGMVTKSLRSVNSDLITEVPIPGATRDKIGLNETGFADLYESSGNVVAGIHGYYPESDKTKPLEYENMPNPDNAANKFTKWALIRPKPVKYGPKLGKLNKKTGKRPLDTSPDFPANFWVADIKPLWEYKLAEGNLQLKNYITGFDAFVKKAKSDGMTNQTSTTGDYLGEASKPLTIPNAVNYEKFDTEHSNNPKEGIYIPGDGTRLWLYHLPDPKGIYVYFEIKHPYAPAEYPKEKDELLQKLNPLLKELREKQPTIPGKVQTKRRPAAGAKENGKKKPQDSGASSRTGVIQRKPKTQDWSKRKKDWEDKRQKWDKGAKTFLKSAGEGPAERQKIDQALKIPTSGKHKKENEDLKSIQLWSGTTGKLMGELRWRFGALFDKLSEFFDKAKQKFEHWHKKSKSIVPKGKLAVGWVNTASKVILKIAGQLFRETLTLAYSSFAACANGLIDKLISQFIDGLTEELHDELEGAHKKVEELHTALEEKFKEYSEPLEIFVEAAEKLKQWEDILSALEIAIRLGVQIVSCGTPPGLGCLWGLVAQVGIGTALELLSDTDYFNDRIARPTAQKLMNDLLGDTFRGLVADAVSAVGLKDYAKGVDACMPRKYISADGGDIGGGVFDPNAPDVAKARAAWEKKYHDQIMNDLKGAFEKGDEKDGKPVTSMTEDDIKKLLEAMKKSKLTPDEMKKSFEAAKNKKTGKFNFDGALSGLSQEGGAGEEATIDDKKDEGGDAKVVDNTVPFEELPSGLKVASQFGATIHTKSGHTQGTKVKLTIDIFRDKEYLVTLVNVPATVAGRAWYPSEADKQYLKITYDLERAVHYAPYAPGAYLTGNKSRQIWGYLKYGI